ncbi:hypothetical protein M408DRAFT_332415 [Serendipita vermifera MAFF 305830]|uniref:Uncharacterized protein n=2 Tax=Serendipita vermifera MAFF 305830 TaxID=933852 RepID=A0A0C2X1D8_SERVB|nr:hypothetical protein M408DRAFT_332415 [Serendipita vermifera MAFF 305830]
MASKQDPLAELEGVAPCKELNAIVEGAFNSLQIIEPWRGASTDHPQLQQVIQKIQGHTIVYFEAIDTSIKTAQDGYGFSCDAIELCGYLLDPETDTDDLQEYIGDMQSKAKRAHEDSLMTLNKFRDVRKGLIEITKTIPKEALAGPEGAKGFFIKLISPLIGGKRDVSLESAIKELNLAALDMAKLADNVDKFADWWSGMETVLKKAEKSASDLRPGKDKLRVKGIQKTWTTIRDDYKQYKVQIIQLQDHYTQGIEPAK